MARSICARPCGRGAGRGRYFSRPARASGTVTRPGLPLPPGEPAINPVPRQMMRDTIAEAAAKLGVGADAEIEISIPGGEEMAKHTLNGRLGIVGGLSILGTTGIVTPFSCAAWIDSIHRGVDVARASGLAHIAGTTGSTSEAAVRALYGLPETALIEMGDFVGGLLKYLRSASRRARHHRRRLRQDDEARAGSARSAFGALQRRFRAARRKPRAKPAPMRRDRGDDAPTPIARSTRLQIARAAGVDLAAPIARAAWETAARALDNAETELEIIVFDRDGGLLARAPFRKVLS